MNLRQTILWLIWFALMAWNCRGSSVGLAWDPSPSTNTIIDYIVDYGVASRTYTNHMHVGTNLTATITNLVPATKYFFAERCMDIDFQLSGYSTEISTTTPTNRPTVIYVNLSVLTNSRLSSLWGVLTNLPVLCLTSPLVPTFYRSRMNITTTTNPPRKILKLDSSTLVFTNP